MKKFISLVLALIMAFSFCSIFAFAEDEEETAAPEVTASDIVANVYLCSEWNNVVPHVYIYVENLTDGEITVGNYVCPAGQGVSVGTYGMTVDPLSNGIGVFYNIELRRNSHKNFICLKQEVTASQLSSLSSYIAGYDFFDPIIFNCCFFAGMCWNKVSSKKVTTVVVLPWITRLVMRLYGATSSKPDFYYPADDQVFSQSGSTLKVVSSSAY